MSGGKVKREHFSSRSAAIMAMAGSAIGLGNIWRFPYMVGEHGGAAFVLIYVAATLLVSLPVFIAEISVGRRSRCNSYSAMSTLDPGPQIWKAAGLLSILIPILIDSYYSVIGGWSLEYLFMSVAGEFIRTEPDAVGGIFGSFISSPWLPVGMHLLFLTVCALIVSRGVKTGIEKFSKISIPALFVMILAIIVYNIFIPGSGEGFRYLFKPDFSQMSLQTFAYALGQSFYSLSLGMGAIITYGSYIHRKENLVVSAAGTAISDLSFAILAGMAIMPAVFAAGIEPGAGPGLIFQTLPFVFSRIGVDAPIISTLLSTVFFLSVVVAAMTSCISLLEVGAGFLSERFGFSRRKSVTVTFIICGVLGIVCSLSFGPLAGIQIGGKCIFDMLDWLCSNVLLLVLAFITVVFVGFVMSKDDVRDEVTNHGEKAANAKLFPVIYFLIKWVAPIAIAAIFITNFIL